MATGCAATNSVGERLSQDRVERFFLGRRLLIIHVFAEHGMGKVTFCRWRVVVHYVEHFGGYEELVVVRELASSQRNWFNPVRAGFPLLVSMVKTIPVGAATARTTYSPSILSHWP